MSAHRFRIDLMPVVSVALLVVIALGQGLGGWFSSQSEAAAEVSVAAVDAYRADTQPAVVLEADDQWVASFQLSTDSPEPIRVSAITVWPRGNLSNKLLGYHTIYPIRLKVAGEVVGEGSGWYKEFIYIENLVELTQPLELIAGAPVVVDVYADLPGTYRKRFGVYLGNIQTDRPVRLNLPAQGFLYGVRDRLGRR